MEGTHWLRCVDSVAPDARLDGNGLNTVSNCVCVRRHVRGKGGLGSSDLQYGIPTRKFDWLATFTTI